MALLPILAQNVLDRFGFAREIGDRTDAASVWIGLDKTKNTMLERALPCGDRCPQHGGKFEVEGGEIAHHTLVCHLFQIRHFSRIH